MEQATQLRPKLTDAERLKVILRALRKYARPKILKCFNADSCIATTKVAVDVLNHFGYHAKPQPVRVLIYNWKLYSRLNTFDGIFREGEWSVGLGFEGGKTITQGVGAYAGHLVALLEREKGDYIIDLSLDQASRPHKDIHLEPSVWYLPKQWRNNEDSDIKVVLKGDKSSLIYYPIHNDDYLKSPNWTELYQTRPIVDNLISIINKKLQ